MKSVKKVNIPDNARPRKNKAFRGYGEKGQAIFLLVILILFAVDWIVMIIGSFLRHHNIAGSVFLFLLFMFFVPYKNELKRACKRIKDSGKKQEQEEA